MRKIKETQKNINEQRRDLLQGMNAFVSLFDDSEEIQETGTVARRDVPPPANPDRGPRNPDGIVDVVTFCEHPHYLDLHLTPWQKMILKIFYKGTHGNQHLEIEDLPDKSNCEGCIWSYNRQTEIDCWKSRQDGGFGKQPWMKLGNSPCLTCVRFDQNIRGDRYQWEIDGAENEDESETIVDLRDRDLLDNFITEKMAFERDLKPEVRDQVAAKIGKSFQELILVLGRRSGKSFMVSVIALYEVYKFIMMKHPQKRFQNLMPYDTIGFLNVAISESQAKKAIFDKIRNLVFTSPYFTNFIGKDTDLEIHFLTDADKEENKRREAGGQTQLTGTLQLICGHSNSNTLLGNTLAVIIIDEMAAMAKASQQADDDEGSDGDLYGKLKPSIATFGRQGKIICLSNPLGPWGKFYKLYLDSFKPNNKTTLMFQMPTWISNPTIEKAYLDGELEADAKNYGMHYGAEFGESGSEPFLPTECVDSAFDRGKGRRRAENGAPLVRYFAHLDPATSSDNYTLVVLHTEPMDHLIGPDRQPLHYVIIDHIMIWRPRGPNHPVNIKEVDAYVLDLATKFKFEQISYDQWNSHDSINTLKNHGLRVVCTPFNQKYQDLIFQEMYDIYTGERVEMYTLNTYVKNANILEADEARKQLKLVQRKVSGKRIKIEALPGQKDDIVDCIAGALYQALKTKVYTSLPRSYAINLGGRLR